jgi:DNA repair protein RadD
MMNLRPYQREAVEAVIRELAKSQSTLLVAPVGAGKTIMQAALIQRMIEAVPESRFICAAHTRELVAQNTQAMLRAWPAAPAGLNSAALGRRDTRSQILFCSIQSVYKKARQIGWCDCLIVDECHLISPNSHTMFRRFIAELREISPHMRVMGMSGTPYRLDSGRLTDGDNSLFKSVAYEIGIRQLIDEGYLTRPISKATATKLDVSRVAIRGGDYVATDLERVVNVANVTAAAVEEIIAFGSGAAGGAPRKAWLVFCAGVNHAANVRDAFRARGISCDMVEGTMNASDRARIIRDFQNGRIQCISNVNVLSIGFDYPGIDLIALMRPTKSASLFVQQCGRGLRLAPGKSDTLILDFAGNVRTLGPIDMVDPKKPGDGKGEAPCRECPDCHSLVHIAQMTCPVCGHEWPPAAEPKHDAAAEPKHDAVADDDTPILSTERVPPRMLPVVTWSARVHCKPDKPPSMRVAIFAGLQEYPEWIAFQHEGYARQKAQQWWTAHGGHVPFPATTDEALQRFHAGEVRPPASISVRRNGKFHDIVSRSFKQEAA